MILRIFFVKKILKTLEKHGFEAYIVGGAVRDFVLGRKTNDFDIATNALPMELVGIFGPLSGKNEYGSYHIKYKGINVDITTYRKVEIYQKGHLATINYANNLLEDAKRRDFTMNAIYENKKGIKIDPYDGLKHLKEKRIVCIGDPQKRFLEDPLRILRAIRFAAVYQFSLEDDIKEAIILLRHHLKEISMFNKKKELDRIFLANGFDLLKEYYLDEVLDLEYDNITYVPDLVGLWAQVKTNENYCFEKAFKNELKKVQKVINCGTMNVVDLYQNGLYVSLVCADILKLDRQKIEVQYSHLPITRRKEIKLSPEEIPQIVGCERKQISFYLTKLTEAILTHKVKNKRKDLINYLEKMKGE